MDLNLTCKVHVSISCQLYEVSPYIRLMSYVRFLFHMMADVMSPQLDSDDIPFFILLLAATLFSTLQF